MLAAVLKRSRREDIDVNGAAKNAATPLQEKDKAVTLSTSAVRVNNEKNDQLQDDIFPFELCSYPATIFEARHIMRPANRPAHADAIWVLIHIETLLGQPVKASRHMYWMTGPWCTEYRGSGVQSIMTYVDITQTPALARIFVWGGGHGRRHPALHQSCTRLKLSRAAEDL